MKPNIFDSIDILIQQEGYNVMALENAIQKYFSLKGDRIKMLQWYKRLESSFDEDEISAGAMATEYTLMGDLHSYVEVKGDE